MYRAPPGPHTQICPYTDLQPPLIWKMKNDLIFNPHGCPNGLETMSENLMLKFWFRDQVAPPLVEEGDVV
jgi:hypothetical protein